MKIGVLADTHDCLPKTVPHLLEEVDQIWHLGDVCSPFVLDELLQMGKPLKTVRGNCDRNSEWPLTLDLTVGSFRFFLVHIPPEISPVKADCLLHGHTHIPRDQMVGGVRFLNPGSAGKADKGAPPSLAILEILEPGKMTWTMRRV